MSSTTGFLSLHNVTKSYGPLRAIDHVSLDIERGEFVALLGPSGSGKSTLLMAIAGFVMPESGEIRLQGNAITLVPPHRRNIGVVFQQYALFPHMSVAKNIAFPLAIRGVQKAQQDRAVRDILNLIQLPEVGARLPRQLSGGQQQRVALARALIFQPPLLLMDEPLGALDRKLRTEMQREIRQIQQRLGITTLYVTHDQDEALSMADRIAVVDRGSIVQLATPRTIYERPVSEFVADFLGEANLLSGTIVSPNGSAVLRTNGGFEIRLRDAGGRGSGPAKVMLRPERIRRVAPGSPGACTATVREAAYFGALVRLVLIAQGESLIALMDRDELPMIPSPGDAVCIGWSEDAPLLLHEGCNEPAATEWRG
jgi:putative spermidine/putrescine transport system ATP-binding protein